MRTSGAFTDGNICTAQNIGAITFLGTAGSIFGNIAVQKLGQILPDLSRAELLQLTTGTHGESYQNLPRELQSSVSEEVTLAIRNVFGIIMVVSALSLIVSLFLSVSCTFASQQ
jgi:hypothetical protein